MILLLGPRLVEPLQADVVGGVGLISKLAEGGE